MDEDDNFAKIMERLPDLKGLSQSELTMCTVPQLRDLCKAAGISPVPVTSSQLIPAVLDFQKTQGVL